MQKVDESPDCARSVYMRDLVIHRLSGFLNMNWVGNSAQEKYDNICNKYGSLSDYQMLEMFCFYIERCALAEASRLQQSQSAKLINEKVFLGEQVF